MMYDTPYLNSIVFLEQLAQTLNAAWARAGHPKRRGPAPHLSAAQPR